MERRISALTELGVSSDLPWAGYRVVDRVETQRPWSAWQLIMLPAPADIFVRGAREPVTYFPPAPSPSSGWIRSTGEPPYWKLGFPPPADARVLLAAMQDVDPGSIVILMGEADPNGTYVDAPPQGGPGCAMQVYGSAGVGFCEIEHHASLETRCMDSTVIAAWGTRQERQDLLDALGA
ncbi:MAG: hypothetical protein WDA71_02850 [Actinomycetota bacterium]